MFNDSDKVQGFPIGNENILIHANTISLFRHYDSGRDAGQFLLVRHDANGANDILVYAGNIKSDGKWISMCKWCCYCL